VYNKKPRLNSGGVCIASGSFWFWCPYARSPAGRPWWPWWWWTWAC